MLRQNLKQLQEAQKLEKKCNDYIKQCKNQLDQLKLEYSGRSRRYQFGRKNLNLGSFIRVPVSPLAHFR